MAKLFLDGIFSDNSDSPSSIFIKQQGVEGGVELTGLTMTDPSFTARNNWGTVLSDVSNLQDLASLAGSSNLFSWIGASVMCWKGTLPLSMGIDFYLINYKRGLKLEENLKELVKLASINPEGGTSVSIHGGYAPDIQETNTGFFNGPVTSLKDLFDSNDGNNTIKSNLDSLYEGSKIAKGALTVTFGHKSKIGNLLLSKIDVTESTVEVSDENGGSRKPLYYRVSAQFTGVRPLLTSDVDAMFTF